MRVSLRWIREMVSVDADDAEVARRLTMAGLEVEAVERFGDDLTALRVAEVRNSARLPDSDHLSVVEVADGAGLRRVVCGAPNVPAPGGRVALAPPGTTLPSGAVVAARTVRGVESAGMLCSEAELGIGDDDAGLLLLGDDVAVGESLSNALSLRDTILDLAVAPNRPDCLGHVGVAREVAALFGARLALPPADLGEFETAPPTRDFISVDLQDNERCSRYVARLAWDVVVAQSPFWLRWRLRTLGVRALGNVVDVTNLVLLESGHPLHAFDLDLIADGRIVVRRARPNEILATLDDTARELSSDDLVIADSTRPLAIAGIMGGKESEVRAHTRRIALEAAAFDPPGIRRTSRRLGLRSESSIRFERGCDLEGLEWASRRAARLILELGGGRLSSGSVDVRRAPPQRREIRLRPDRCRALLGLDLDAKAMTDTLESLGLSVRPEGDGADTLLRVTVPSHRLDIAREADLAEEIVRIRGLDGVVPTLPAGDRAPEHTSTPVSERVRDTLAAAGLHETVSLAFAGPLAPPAPGNPLPVTLRNPLREDCSSMRTWLFPGLLAALRRNHERGVANVGLFEIGRVFALRDGEALPAERNHAAAMLSGARPAWLAGAEPVDFFDLKGFVEQIASSIRVRFDFAPSALEFLHPGAQAAITTERGPVGWIGAVHPARLRDESLPAALAFELDLDALEAPGPARMRPLPRFPGVVRDLSFFVRSEVPWTKIRDALLGAQEPLLESSQILEDYRDPNRVPVGHKGLFLSLRYRAADRTLTDDETNAAHERLVAGLVSAFTITRR